jgi:Pentapeptide repeats (8 copies)
MADLEHVELLKKGIAEWNEASSSIGFADLSDANLRFLDLRDADLRDADLSGADLEGANLNGANLRDADLTAANLPHADLSIADLDGANLLHANLQSANLEGANLNGATLIGAYLIDANLRRTNLRRVIHDASTVWPAGFNAQEQQGAETDSPLRFEKIGSLAQEEDRLHLALSGIEPLIDEVTRAIESGRFSREDEARLAADRSVLNSMLRHPDPPVQVVEATTSDVARILAPQSNIGPETTADLVAAGVPSSSADRIGRQMDELFHAVGALDLDQADGGLTQLLEKAAEVGNEIEAAAVELELIDANVPDEEGQPRRLRTAASRGLEKGIESGVEKGVEQLVSTLIGKIPAVGTGVVALVAYLNGGAQVFGRAGGIGAMIVIAVALTKRKGS